MQTIYLDISNKGVVPTIHAKQGDVGRKFQVVLTDSGLPYIPVGGSAFSVWYSGASGEGNYTEVGDKSAFSVSGNKVTVEMISQMLSNDGEGILSLVLNDPNGNQISTWNIHYICEYVPGAGSQEAKVYYTAFSQAVENLPYPDASLSASGKAADAAATGMALAGKAPAGYGLGGFPTEIIRDVAALDNLNLFGLYKFEADSTIINGVFFNYATVLVYPFSADTFVQEIRPVLSNVVLRRFSYSSTFDPWECENPHMVPGVECRTTERWNGKPVYTMLINCGTMPTAGSTIRTDMPSNIYGTIDKVIRCRGADSSGNTIPFSWEGEYRTEVSASRAAIFIYAKDDYSGNTADVTIWYTKY